MGTPSSSEEHKRISHVAGPEWKRLKDIRLAALSDSPKAFLSDPDVERAQGDERWMTMCEASYWFVATVDGQVVGLGSELIAHAEGEARRRGETSIGLWVFEGNENARRLYASRGYVSTGRTSTLPDGRQEEELERSLD
jgi:GNAT superfamily N-acetyltransferase